jgi:hypothetical protein
MDEQAKLKAIGQLIKTQDNRITDAPVFIVQQSRRIWGMDSEYSDDYVWIEIDSGDYSESEADQKKAEELEALDNACEYTPGWQKYYYQDMWEFVTACFTEKGCRDFINRNGHNLHNPRIYAEGSYRNEEWRTIRDFLINLGESSFEEQPTDKDNDSNDQIPDDVP